MGSVGLRDPKVPELIDISDRWPYEWQGTSLPVWDWEEFQDQSECDCHPTKERLVERMSFEFNMATGLYDREVVGKEVPAEDVSPQTATWLRWLEENTGHTDYFLDEQEKELQSFYRETLEPDYPDE